MEEEAEVAGVAISFFMKDAAEERIQVFDLAVRGEDEGDSWEVKFSRKESSGELGDLQYFEFTSSEKAKYIRIESVENSVNK